jgi:hypothetical protein
MCAVMKNSSRTKEIIQSELVHIIQNNCIQNKLLQKIIDKLEKQINAPKTINPASKESQH